MEKAHKSYFMCLQKLDSYGKGMIYERCNISHELGKSATYHQSVHAPLCSMYALYIHTHVRMWKLTHQQYVK